MISVYHLKSKFQGLLRPLVHKLAAGGVTANQVTLSAVILSAVWGLCMAIAPDHNWPWLLLPLVMFVRMALNAVDGMLAREHNMKSRLGAVLNELGDVVSDTLLYIPFMLIAGKTAIIVALICVFAVVSEMAGVVGVQVGASRRYDGPMGKSDRAFVFGTAGLILGLGYAPGAWLDIIFVVVLLLLFYTVYNRAKNALKEGAA